MIDIKPLKKYDQTKVGGWCKSVIAYNFKIYLYYNSDWQWRSRHALGEYLTQWDTGLYLVEIVREMGLDINVVGVMPCDIYEYLSKKNIVYLLPEGVCYFLVDKINNLYSKEKNAYLLCHVVEASDDYFSDYNYNQLYALKKIIIQDITKKFQMWTDKKEDSIINTNFSIDKYLI